MTRIDVLDAPFQGYYQMRRYVFEPIDGTPPTPVTTMRVRSLIVSPADGATVRAGPLSVRGKAWSGEGPVEAVEIAVDGGDAWREATLGPAPSPYVWQSWEFTWDAKEPGRYVLRSRARDAKGNRQPDIARWNRHGYGNNAIHGIVVNVR